MEEKKYVVDTSVVIEGLVSQFIKNKKIFGEIIIPKAVLAELEHQANTGQEIGFLGLEEIQRIQKLVKEGKTEIKFTGERPNIYQIAHAKDGGEIDSLIKDIAYNEGAILITADKVQSASAKALNVEVLYCHHEELSGKLQIEKYFDPTTMSVHLKEDCKPKAKRGKPGEWRLYIAEEKELAQHQVQEIAKEIVERSRIEPNAFIEISRPGSTIVQYKDYRIVISKPPVSDGWEITAVKPIKILKIEDYNLPEKIAERVKTKARGVVIAGTTGSGKCLPKGTKVYLKENITKNIEEVKLGDCVLSYDKNCKITHSKVTKTFNRKVNSTLLIKTNYGKEIELTQDHPVMSFKEGIPQWIPAKELLIGSRTATVRKLDNEGSIQKIEWIDLIPNDTILIEINRNLKKEACIEDIYKGLKYNIIKVIKESGKVKLNDIHKRLNSKSGWISALLLKLLKEGAIKRDGKEKKYVYSLAKTKIKLNKGIIIPLINLRKYLTKEEIYETTKNIYKFDTWHKCSSITPPRYLTKELCELIGHLISESLTKYGISTDSQNCKKRFIELSKSIFNIEITKSRDKFNAYTDKYGTIELFLNKCFGISKLSSKQRSTYHRVPAPILKSPKLEMASLLRSYFDAESYCHKEKGIEVSSASIGLIQDVQYLLMHFNIQSSIREKIINNKSYYILYIYRYNNVKRFKEEIGPIDKQEQIEAYLKNSKPGSPNKDTIPVGFLLNNIKKRESIQIKYPFLERDFSRERARTMLMQMGSKITTFESLVDTAMIELAISDYIQWDKVIAIIEINKEQEVYDIEVENTHNFLAGDVPFLVHNSTFAQSLAEYYSSNNFVTKTVESPRSLILSKEITQYSKNLASSEEIHDILFLSRPDYILFDEMRNTPDFELYTDLRLGGSNVLGVLHAATPIDAVQRFISRMDVGMIPSVLDTLIFIEKGNVEKIMIVSMIVKVPSGMTEADLARPVVEVRNFDTNKLEFEIYSYGEETVVIPVDEDFIKEDPTKILAAKQLERELRQYASDVKVKIINNNKAEVYIPEGEIAKFIGKEGKNIDQIEKKVGFGLTVKELTQRTDENTDKEPIHHKIEESKKAVIFKLPNQYAGYNAEVYVDGHFLLAYTVGKNAEIKINKNSKLGQEILNDLNKKRNVEVRI